MKKLINFSILLLLFMPQAIQCQLTTEETLHDRYWSYRERFRKYFTSIGWKAGQGIPFSELSLGKGAWFGNYKVEVDPITKAETNLGERGDMTGKLNVGGDVIAYMAEYLGILSTEYWLLKHSGRDGSEEMKAVLNELYFAINDVERLDKYAKKYYTDVDDENIDGFFVRDDSPPAIQEAFNVYEYPQIRWMESINAKGMKIDENLSDKPLKIYADFIQTYPTYDTFKIRLQHTDGLPNYSDEEIEQKGLNEMSLDRLKGFISRSTDF